MVNSEKTCFVISPIGSEESKTRERSDLVLEYIIKPAAKECGYKAVRADEISEPGIITTQVIQRLIEDDLVIADLTEKNPNVFYELAIRHAVRKPIVQMIKHDERIPFDVVTQRTIHYDIDLKSAVKCRDELIKQIRAAEKEPEAVDSPVSTAIDLKVLRESENPVEKSIVEIIPMLEDIRTMIQNTDAQPQGFEIPSDLLDLIVRFADAIPHFVSPDQVKFYEYYKKYLHELIDVLKPRISERNRYCITLLGRHYDRAIAVLREEEKSKRGADEEE